VRIPCRERVPTLAKVLCITSSATRCQISLKGPNATANWLLPPPFNFRKLEAERATASLRGGRGGLVSGAAEAASSSNRVVIVEEHKRLLFPLLVLSVQRSVRLLTTLTRTASSSVLAVDSASSVNDTFSNDHILRDDATKWRPIRAWNPVPTQSS
jgi:hypothetical protein